MSTTYSKRELEAAIHVVATLARPLDQIPYTPLFDDAHSRFCDLMGHPVSRDRTWQVLLSARKRGQTPARFRGK